MEVGPHQLPSASPGHAPLPHTAGFWRWLPLGTPSCSLSGSDKGNYLTAELAGWLLRHLPEISCGQCIAEVNGGCDYECTSCLSFQCRNPVSEEKR